ncbi:UDP-3-O-[3-hydroxymyristoyl] glucosamine N-acyltransferase [Desulfatibacillum alkenivorans DSM 16219]|jgi:UDP-3-O-[3-hydroxymyristoyl] glucosamine N-acyltransferase|uniref:UDP-3-O-acylglucosamine N-acyltransferase n=1 Tax=Desulfatibacillum alkenivorans DSM 16219 TaxID=1121393 RepID=A0A1M6CLH1_9BACT|nr:UDP-3-O-(3-hydroxymyristoyl)glucosamine N-acyltransferase [Desulfatibacillum alkenivorans]SHI61885.1 UDP-3-O-[3-hydroxymyristoyl] glucosamine N-acyltransferase [Desulfatibacillum alkenivorans DSM 16219]
MTTYTLDYLAEYLGGAVQGDPALEISGVMPFEEAGPQHITCAANAKYFKRLAETRAGAVIVAANAPDADRNLIRVQNPYACFARAIALYNPPPKPAPGVHPGVHVGENFSSGENFSAAPGVVIGSGVAVGSNVILMPNVVLGDGVKIGDDVTLYPNVTILDNCQVGDRTIIHAGTVIGADGYGFAPDGGRYEKIPQIGNVRIGDDVEIGANNTIDRATFGSTYIGNGVKTDNLVHVGHNVQVGDDTLLVAQAGISGSSKLGRRVVIAGQAGISDHVTIGDDTVIGPQAGIAKDLEGGQFISGSPGIPHRLWLRVQRIIPQLPELAKEIRNLAKRIKHLEDKIS